MVRCVLAESVAPTRGTPFSFVTRPWIRTTSLRMMSRFSWSPVTTNPGIGTVKKVRGIPGKLKGTRDSSCRV
jgi:hypothetical protein